MEVQRVKIIGYNKEKGGQITLCQKTSETSEPTQLCGKKVF